MSLLSVVMCHFILRPYMFSRTQYSAQCIEKECDDSYMTPFRMVLIVMKIVGRRKRVSPICV
jgi:hypothetical protein